MKIYNRKLNKHYFYLTGAAGYSHFSNFAQKLLVNTRSDGDMRELSCRMECAGPKISGLSICDQEPARSWSGDRGQCHCAVMQHVLRMRFFFLMCVCPESRDLSRCSVHFRMTNAIILWTLGSHICKSWNIDRAPG